MGSEAMDPTGRPSPSFDLDGALESWELVDLETSMTKLLVGHPAAAGLQQVERDSLVSRSKNSSATVSASDSGANEARPSVDVEDVDSFLQEALQGKDRLTILRIEQDVIKFMRNPKLQQLEFQPMPSSYLRLAAHRVVQHYNLQSLVADSSNPDNTRIIAKKTPQSRFPRIRLSDIPSCFSGDDNQISVSQQKFELKRRPNWSSKFNREGASSTESMSKMNPAKSVEERKEEYNRARARIFKSSDNGGRSDEELSAADLDFYPSSVTRYDKKTEQSSTESYNASVKVPTGRSEKDLSLSYNKVNNRVAIFRDKEKDKKDPDYDRSYDRYMQRFDPGFGVSQGPYCVQPMYSPMVNYNTEFPQLGGGIRPQMCVEPSVHRAVPPPVRGPWAGSSNSLNFSHPDSMMGNFNSSHLGSGSGVYMHPPQFSRPAHTMSYVQTQEQFSSSVSQSHLQPEGSFSQARRQ